MVTFPSISDIKVPDDYEALHNIIRIERNGVVIWQKQAPKKRYIKFTASSAQILKASLGYISSALPTLSLEYSYDGVDYIPWSLTSTTSGGRTYFQDIPFGSTNPSVYIRGINSKGLSFHSQDYDSDFIFSFTNSTPVECEGNIMALINYNTLPIAIPSLDEEVDEFEIGYCFYNLFKNCTALISAPEFPAETLTKACYRSAFQGCINLEEAPKLPATALADSCYKSLFEGCINLQLPTIEEGECYLPAINAAISCYHSMFKGCTSLNIPDSSIDYVFAVTTVAESSFAHMFENCTSLTVTPSLPATTLANYCYDAMFKDCTSLTATQSELPASVLQTGCYRSMFEGCNKITKSPYLPAIALVSYCYNRMFYGCSSLAQIEVMATNPDKTVSGNPYTDSWVYGVANSGEFLTQWQETADLYWKKDSVSGIPVNWFLTHQPTIYRSLSATIIDGTSSSKVLVSATAYGGNNSELYYKLNEGRWTKLSSEIELNNGDTIYFAGNNPNGFSTSAAGYKTINLTPATTNETPHIKLSGDIMALINGETQAESLIIPSQYCFYKLFAGSKCLYNINDLYLSPTTLTVGCYSRMFENCINLSTAAYIFNDSDSNSITYLPNKSLEYMFKGCSSLNSQAPARFVFVDEVGKYACRSMFEGCSIIRGGNIPLNPTTVHDHCFDSMYKDCFVNFTNALNNATTLAPYCYRRMFYNALHGINLDSLGATTLAEGCYEEMFMNCWGYVNGTLPVETLEKGCYRGMFAQTTMDLTKYGIRVVNPEMLPSTSLAEECYKEMFMNCSMAHSLGDSGELKLPATTLVRGCYMNMFKGAADLSKLTCLATDISATGALSNWFYGFNNVRYSGTNTFVKKTATTYPSGPSGIPTSWTIQNI